MPPSAIKAEDWFSEAANSQLVPFFRVTLMISNSCLSNHTPLPPDRKKTKTGLNTVPSGEAFIVT